MAVAKTKKAKWTNYATGRRKTSSARAYIAPKSEGEVEFEISVNGLDYEKYFPRPTSQMIIRRPFQLVDRVGKYKLMVKVAGGGPSGQAGAVVHAIARVLERAEPELRPILKKAGLLTRDSRVVERKKPGRRKARKGTQFSKR